MTFRFVARSCAALPRLGWVASIGASRGDVEVVHGTGVERGKSWVVEGVWDAPFERADFHRSEAFFGSGIHQDTTTGRVVACASTALTDRLLYGFKDDRIVVSNSLVLILAFLGCRLDLDWDYAEECAASLKGIWGQPHPFRAAGPWSDGLHQLHYGNLVVEQRAIAVELRSSPRAFGCYADYAGVLNATLDRIRHNYCSEHRRMPMRAYSTLSTGYDSVAVSCLAKRIGVRECFTTAAPKPGGSGEEECGLELAAALGIEPHLLGKPSAGISLNEAYFIAPTFRGSELIFHDLARHVESQEAIAAVFTGYHGDKVWDVHIEEPYLVDDIRRGDASGLNLSEIRLKSGFVNVAVPFLYARAIASLATIGRSSEMAPWRIGGDYDRPIPRRIAEQAGTPRNLFGLRKRMVMSYYNKPYNAELRGSFYSWMNETFSHGSARVAAYEKLDAIGWRFEARRQHSLAAEMACRVPQSLKQRLFRGHDLRQLMFKWAANHLAEEASGAFAGAGVAHAIERT